MSSCDEFIEKAKKILPDLCTTKDLVKLGLYKSEQAAYSARKRGLAPDFFRLPHGTVVYPIRGVIEMLEKSTYTGRCSDEDYNPGRAYSKSTG